MFTKAQISDVLSKLREQQALAEIASQSMDQGDFLRGKAEGLSDAIELLSSLTKPQDDRRPFVSSLYPTRESLPPRALELLTNVLDRGAHVLTGHRYGQLLVRHGYAKKRLVGRQARIYGL